ncbi:MAG: DNA cytosine methyltransferase [Acidobacteriota bacterium]|nr:DNA cytosine methyltransferase [Acidobacteriota bacterium]MDE3265839.1 DNA cytosine methyltransferase [Acidobacteriota bacterium]
MDAPEFSSRNNDPEWPRKVHAVDLFCGIGGLTHGLRLAGVDVRAGVDNDPACRYAYEANNEGAAFVEKDVSEVTFDDLKSHYGDSAVRALVGCAPCQPFSAHNRHRATTDTDCSLVRHFARIVREGQPELVLMENVPGLASHPAFGELLDLLRELEYTTSVDPKLSCKQFGVPQNRRRLVLLASLIGPVSLPAGDATPPTVADCIQGLPPIQAGEGADDDPAHVTLPLSPLNQERIRHSRQGGSWEDWPAHLRSPCHNDAYYPAPYGRMRWSGIAPTITTQFCYYSTGRFGHPEQDRTISIREGAILQTFPTDYRLVDEENPPTVRELARQVGNAVPVELGRAIGAVFQEAVFQEAVN